MSDNQKVINYFEVRQSLVVLFSRILFFELVMTVIYFVGQSALNWFTGSFVSFSNMNGFLFHGLVQLFDAFGLIFITLFWTNRFYRINIDSISAFEGFFHKKTEIITMDNISTVNLYQGFFGRIFNYGTIRIDCRFSRQVINIKSISKPDFYRKALQNLMVAAAADRPVFSNSANPGTLQQQEIFNINGKAPQSGALPPK